MCAHARNWAFLWIIIQSTVFLFTTKECQGYKLSFPKRYVALTGDIPVLYSIEENETISEEGVVQLVSLTNGTVLATVNILIGKPSYELTFMCGLVDHAGRFLFQLVDSDGEEERILVKSHVMRVTWPKFTLRLPDALTALTQETELIFVRSGAQCDSSHMYSRYWIDIEFLGKNYTQSSREVGKPLSVFKKPIDDLLKLKEPHRIPCNVFDQAGMYRAVFRSSYNKSAAIAVSNVMSVSWGSEYSLTLHSSSVFPCKRWVAVTYKQPICTGSDDKIRLFAQNRAEDSPVASPWNLRYIAEQRALSRQGTTTVMFKCNLFHETTPGYCFKYISIAKSGAVSEQAMVCIPSKDEGPVVNGGWSMWSAWSACSATCGSGRRTRFRACDNPLPRNGGRFCAGELSELEACGPPCKEIPTTTHLSPFGVTPECACGCNYGDPHGRIASDGRCPGSSVWIIRVEEGYVIKMEFLLFNLEEENQWVKIRDGDSQNADMLLYSTGLSPAPTSITSTVNALLLELNMPEKRKKYHSNIGFVAKYTSFVNSGAVMVPANGEGDHIHWHSTVTIVGITVCAIIILATILFICHHRWMRKQSQKRKEMYATNAATQQALLSNGDIPQSPSISSPGSPSSGPNSGSANIGFSDGLPSPVKLPMTPEELPSPDAVPTPDAHCPDFYVITQGVLASPSHTPSVMSEASSITRLKSRSHSNNASPNHVPYQTGSPVKSPNKVPTNKPVKPTSLPFALPSQQIQNTSLTSPYAANANPNDYLHEPALFKSVPPGSKTHHPHHHHSNSREHRDSKHSHSNRTRSPHSGDSLPGSRERSKNMSRSHSRSFEKTPTNHTTPGSGHGSVNSPRREVNSADSPHKSATRGSISSDGSRHRRSRGSAENVVPSPSHSLNQESDRSKGSKKRPLSGVSVKDKNTTTPTAMTTINENITLSNKNDRSRRSNKKKRSGEAEGHDQSDRHFSRHSGHRDSDRSGRHRRRSDKSHRHNHHHHQSDDVKHSSGKGKSTPKHRPKTSNTPHVPEAANTESLTTGDVQNANYITPARSPNKHTTDNRPHVKDLPLRHIERPDGQSPQEKIVPEMGLGSPTSHVSSEMTPKHQLHQGRSRSQTPSEFTMDMDFEYDYYMPNVPGSFFYMEDDYLRWPQNMQRQNSGRHRKVNQRADKPVEIPLQEKK